MRRTPIRLLAALSLAASGSLSCGIFSAQLTQEIPAALEMAPLQSAPLPDPAVAKVLEHLSRYKTGLTGAELAELAATIVAEAHRHDFEPGLVLAVMHVESRYFNFAVSPVKALGLMQILPSTGAWLAPQVGVRWEGSQTLFDPTSNVRLGVAYLRQLTDRYGSLSTALTAYNWGPGRIDRRIRRGTPLPTEYAGLVLGAYGETAKRS